MDFCDICRSYCNVVLDIFAYAGLTKNKQLKNKKGAVIIYLAQYLSTQGLRLGL